ncbi:MAG: hypothetical protein QF689_05595 [Candidatus Latescibacteria bacterium]|jgi:hypothetical protein|nr:hypothetical protein [Gemmatimonadaceae bacterium]MDP7448042.1 hypothetical protein [Candidatus Latescibacterota bacterium]HJP31681.1 hypothetical protein [Candidatus Latescibacterota bacterium]
MVQNGGRIGSRNTFRLIALGDIPARSGELPERTFIIPHLQLSQGGALELADRLVEAVDQLDSVSIGIAPLMRDGGMLYNGRSWELAPGAGGGSFGHMHHSSNNSMHMELPRTISRGAMRDGGWGEIHPFSGVNGLGTDDTDYVIIWGARDEEELEVIWLFVQAAYACARGVLP